jgi:hypothetical protein
MPKIPLVKVSLYILFLTKYLGLVLVNQKNGHYCYDTPEKPHLPRRIEFTAHGSTKKDIPGVYVLKTLKKFDLTWDEFVEICKGL